MRHEIAALRRKLTKPAPITTPLRPHGLRVTFATLALIDGVAVATVKMPRDLPIHRPRGPYDRDACALNFHPVHRLIGPTSE